MRDYDYNKYKNDPEFNRELEEMLNEYAGRPSRLYYAERMTKDLGGAIVGSAIVKIIGQYGKEAAPYVKEFVQNMKHAIG